MPYTTLQLLNEYVLQHTIGTSGKMNDISKYIINMGEATLLIPFRLVIFSMQLEERDRTLHQIKQSITLNQTRMKTSTHSQHTRVERAASIFSIGGICMYSLTAFDSFGSSPDFSAWISTE